jgi:hypothetical protein
VSIVGVPPAYRQETQQGGLDHGWASAPVAGLHHVGHIRTSRQKEAHAEFLAPAQETAGTPKLGSPKCTNAKCTNGGPNRQTYQAAAR